MKYKHQCLVCKTNLPYPQNYHVHLQLQEKDYLACERYKKAGIDYQASWIKKLHNEMGWLECRS